MGGLGRIAVDAAVPSLIAPIRRRAGADAVVVPQAVVGQLAAAIAVIVGGLGFPVVFELARAWQPPDLDGDHAHHRSCCW